MDSPVQTAPRDSTSRLTRQFAEALVVGLLTGLLAVAFHLSLEHAEALRTQLASWAGGEGIGGLLLTAAGTAAVVACAVWLVRAGAPEAAGSGIPHIKGVLHHGYRLAWLPILFVKFVGGVLAIGAGLALGREGPTVQMGAAVGHATGGWWRVPPADQRRLVALGAAAGIAGAFDAPLAGALFLLEELRGVFRPSLYLQALTATVGASVVCHALLGSRPEYSMQHLGEIPLGSLPLFLLLGLLAGVLGVGFNKTLLATLDLFAWLRNRVGAVGVGALAGAAGGVVTWWRPALVGGGDNLAYYALHTSSITAATVVLVLLVRIPVTFGSYATGAAGGLFAPLLVLGAATGLLVGMAAEQLLGESMPPAAAVGAVGMAALFIGTVRAPLTGVILIVEMTGAASLLVPLLVAGLTANLVADALKDRPIYEALLERDLRARGGKDGG